MHNMKDPLGAKINIGDTVIYLQSGYGRSPGMLRIGEFRKCDEGKVTLLSSDGIIVYRDENSIFKAEGKFDFKTHLDNKKKSGKL